MRRVVVTPAGRKRYLEVLAGNLVRERSDFDEWHLWLNTNVESDLAYCRELRDAHEWVRLVEEPGIEEVSPDNIHVFFKHARDEDSVYIRLDDDIVFLEPGFFAKLLDYRLSNRRPFLVFANIVNNAVITHIHQRNRLVDGPICGYDCLDDMGWKDGPFAEKVHRAFLEDLAAGRIGKWHSSFSTWVCGYFERISINAVSWFGSDMMEVWTRIGVEEEIAISSDIPSSLGRPNEIFGGAIAAHFAFHPQREHMDNTDILSLYRELSRNHSE